MPTERLSLLPLPRSVRTTGEGARLTAPLLVSVPAVGADPAHRRLERTLEELGLEPRVAPGAPGDGGAPPGGIALAIDGRTGQGGSEGYRLEIDARGVRVTGADAAGLFHGVHRLCQIVEQAEAERTALSLPGLVIEDRPAFQKRGAMLDVSRDRVPTMETLFELVELASHLGLNELQLYTEHTFAYREHERVWRGASPLTPDEILRLDAFAAERFVELVPNQQSFGHMHRWLVHEPYRSLAECPAGVQHPFSREREPFSLCPTDPASLAFLGRLYDELLPLFRSKRLNVGLDETFDVGLGRAARAVSEKGAARVYLDFLLGVARLVRERGHVMEFWADIVLHHPELVRELPRDLVPLDWGYEADHPFDRETSALAEAGLAFHVAPGTSSWQSLAGRFSNMTANLESAARHGHGRGAAGLLVTDWGDRGHLQPLPASYPGWVTAADLAWNPDSPAERRTPEGVADLLARHVLRDPSGNAARGLVGLARAAEATGARVRNASPFSLVLTKVDEPFPPPELGGLAPEGIERALGVVDAALQAVADERMTIPARALVRDELVWVGGMLRCAGMLALQRLRAGGARPVAELAHDVRAPLAAELAPLVEEHRRLWLHRSRRGGLERSCEWLERVARELDG
jgi:hexosaminidase